MTPREHLESALASAKTLGEKSILADAEMKKRVDFVCRCISNKAGMRLLLSCMLAKVVRPEVDPRKPYTEIGGRDSFSGRSFDEQYVAGFITDHQLPCNSTTAFLTPALRNRNETLTTRSEMVGRPEELYIFTLRLLDDVAKGRVTAGEILVEAIRVLIQVRDENQSRMKSLVSALASAVGAMPISSEQIVTLLRQHLASPKSSRLPVLIVAAAYQTAGSQLGEKMVALRDHLAADEQTGAGGDIEVCLTNEDRVCTIYEMKSKRVTRGDIDRAIQKITSNKHRVDNYVFITTDVVEDDVAAYAAELYDKTNGIEMVVLDCIGFARHFLHLFHRHRSRFLDAYQSLVLAEPDSAVNQPLKEAFLSLRKAAESDN